MVEFALLTPPNVYVIEQPATYQEAVQRMRSAGEILSDIVDSQEGPQENAAQLLTAQTLKDMGVGWQAIFSAIAEDPRDFTENEARFSWQPGGKMTIVMPERMTSSFCDQAVYPMIRASLWYEALQDDVTYRSLDHLNSEFFKKLDRSLSGKSSSVIEQKISDASISVFGTIYRQEKSTKPVFSDMEINWGPSMQSCFQLMSNKYGLD